MLGYVGAVWAVAFIGGYLPYIGERVSQNLVILPEYRMRHTLIRCSSPVGPNVFFSFLLWWTPPPLQNKKGWNQSKLFRHTTNACWQHGVCSCTRDGAACTNAGCITTVCRFICCCPHRHYWHMCSLTHSVQMTVLLYYSCCTTTCIWYLVVVSHVIKYLVIVSYVSSAAYVYSVITVQLTAEDIDACCTHQQWATLLRYRMSMCASPLRARVCSTTACRVSCVARWTGGWGGGYSFSLRQMHFIRPLHLQSTTVYFYNSTSTYIPDDATCVPALIALLLLLYCWVVLPFYFVICFDYDYYDRWTALKQLWYRNIVLIVTGPRRWYSSYTQSHDSPVVYSPLLTVVPCYIFKKLDFDRNITEKSSKCTSRALW